MDEVYFYIWDLLIKYFSPKLDGKILKYTQPSLAKNLELKADNTLKFYLGALTERL